MSGSYQAALCRMSRLLAAALVQIAEADGFRPSLGLTRRDVFWAIRALRDAPMPLFAAASNREAGALREFEEPAVRLRPMKAADEVVEDYVHLGVTLRAPAQFSARGSTPTEERDLRRGDAGP